MNLIVYLKNDPQRLLYYSNSVPKDVAVIRPTPQIMLEILEKKLSVFDETELDWFYCPISLELPKNPVFYPTPGISNLYEKSKLVEWLAAHPKAGDPLNLSGSVRISDYLTPTPEQLLDFVIQTTQCPQDFFISNYADIQVNALEEHPLIERATRKEVRPKRSCFSVLLNSIFCCCNKETTDEEHYEKWSPSR